MSTDANKHWHAIEITLPSSVTPDEMCLDVLTSLLFEAGAAGLETKDDRPPIRVVAAFDPNFDPDLLAKLVDVALEDSGIRGAVIELTTYDPVDWATHWQRHMQSISFGPLWIVPTWLEPPSEARHVLRLDPSMAFGTGLHATTAMCLGKIVETSPIESILDVGTGSGILALGALELGAKRAVATDDDPDALRVASENAERNGFSHRLELSGEAPDALGARFSVVVANILANPLIDLAPAIARAVAPGGLLVLSGIMHDQADSVSRAYETLGFTKLGELRREEWSRIDLLLGS